LPPPEPTRLEYLRPAQLTILARGLDAHGALVIRVKVCMSCGTLAVSGDATQRSKGSRGVCCMCARDRMGSQCVLRTRNTERVHDVFVESQSPKRGATALPCSRHPARVVREDDAGRHISGAKGEALPKPTLWQSAAPCASKKGGGTLTDDERAQGRSSCHRRRADGVRADAVRLAVERASRGPFAAIWPYQAFKVNFTPRVGTGDPKAGSSLADADLKGSTSPVFDQWV
jgi:hypothetical protein